jgi:signal transduction histidine kinase
MTENWEIVVASDASLAKLRAARARQAAAADGERRRIERALHDGVEQDLVAVAVRLQLARRLVGSDVVAAVALLDEMRGDVRDALSRIRALADGIYPSLLEARGLVEAVRGVASAAGVPARVEQSGIGRYAAEIEAVAYFCCRAALENIAAHAGRGARATIRLREHSDALQVEVLDDGVGFDPLAGPPGSGLTSARDRVEAFGGVLTVESEPGRGTRILAAVPIYGPSSAR